MTDRPLIGYTLCLSEGWHAAECVEPSGAISLWLVSPHSGELHHGCACRDCAPHEQNGALPRAVKLAVGRQCHGISRRSGVRCKNVARVGADFCKQHQASAEAGA